jgi:hypothetical protein
MNVGEAAAVKEIEQPGRDGCAEVLVQRRHGTALDVVAEARPHDIFVADKAQTLYAQANPLIEGFTRNPTLMRAAGVKDYEAFAHEIPAVVTDRPISFEVFADKFDEVERQAHAT